MQRRTSFWQQFTIQSRDIRKRHIGIAVFLTILFAFLYYTGDGIRFSLNENSHLFFFGQAYHELVLLLFSAVIIYVSFVLRAGFALGFSFAGFLIVLPHALLIPAYTDPVYRILSWLTINLLLALAIGGILNIRERQKLYLRGIINTQEEERHRLSRELHDDTAQELIDVGHTIDEIIEMSDDSQQEIVNELHSLRESIDDILEKTRRAIQGLQPPLLDEVGIKPALFWLCDNLTEETDIEVEPDIELPEERLTQELKLVLFRVTQESLTNIRKHSQAHKVTVSLKVIDNRVILTIDDDGVGFTPPAQRKFYSLGQFGLAGMRERLDIVDGSLSIRSKPGEGTTISAEFPVDEGDELPA